MATKLSAMDSRRAAWGLRPSSWTPLLITTAAFSIVTASLSLQWERVQKAPVPAPTVVPQVETPHVPPGIGLKVNFVKDRLEIRWDHHSAVIAQGDKGILKIADGEIEQVIPLEQLDLEDGYVSYTPLTNAIRVRIEITHKDGGTFTESARVVSTP